MFGLMERPYPAHVLISFWCDSDNKNFDFFHVSEFYRMFQFCSFWLSSKFGNSYTPLIGLFLNICSMHIGPSGFAR